MVEVKEVNWRDKCQTQKSPIFFFFINSVINKTESLRAAKYPFLKKGLYFLKSDKEGEAQ